MLGYN